MRLFEMIQLQKFYADKNICRPEFIRSKGCYYSGERNKITEEKVRGCQKRKRS